VHGKVLQIADMKYLAVSHTNKTKTSSRRKKKAKDIKAVKESTEGYCLNDVIIMSRSKCMEKCNMSRDRLWLIN